MKNRELVRLTEAWFVWIGEDSAVRVATEREARELLLSGGRDYEFGNSFNRSDLACSVAELIWNEPLPEGAVCHREIFSPAWIVMRRGQLRKVVRHLSPSKFERIAKSWYSIEPKFPAWWPQQYLAAVNDSETLVLRGKRALEVQVDARWH